MIHAVQAVNLTKRFGKFTAVDGITFSVNRGEIFGFLGANGAGKTTTMRILCGILPPSSAEHASVLNFNLLQDHESVKKHIGYMSQKFSLYNDLTVQENLEFYAGVYGLDTAAANSRISTVQQMIRLKGMNHVLTTNLPAGAKQRLSLACAILHNPAILFLDEPTAGVDPRMRRNFWNLIRDLRSEGMTVFVTTHYMDEAESCDRISIMHVGKIIALDTPQKLKQNYFPFLLYSTGEGTNLHMLHHMKENGVVESFQPFGKTYHITVAHKQNNYFKKAAARQGIKLHNTKPSLEDVFISLLYSHGKNRIET